MKTEHQLQPGDSVKLLNHTAVGEVVRILGKKVIISFDYVWITVPLYQVERVTEDLKNVLASQFLGNARVRVLNLTEADWGNFCTKIDLHGMYVQEALQAVEQWLDKANLLGHKHLQVIHGIGQGILRREIRNYLRAHKLVKKVLEHHFLQGSSGVTGIELA
jgi:DNA mismatch repair protein MutS2